MEENYQKMIVKSCMSTQNDPLIILDYIFDPFKTMLFFFLTDQHSNIKSGIPLQFKYAKQNFDTY